jgi:hypothetical protein
MISWLIPAIISALKEEQALKGKLEEVMITCYR